MSLEAFLAKHAASPIEEADSQIIEKRFRFTKTPFGIKAEYLAPIDIGAYKIHYLTISPNELRCSCPGFMSSKGKLCKHLVVAIRILYKAGLITLEELERACP